MALTEIQHRYRHNVVEILELIASREEQLKYQRDVPIAYVSAELFCMWDESFSPEWLDDREYCAPFSGDEIWAMNTFNQVVNDVISFFPKSLPSIEQFILTPQWEQLSQAASKALLSFRKNDL